MPSRNTYTALTPDYANFVIPHSVEEFPDSARGPTREGFEGEATLNQSKWRATLNAARGRVKNNAGLLLIVGAQAFFSLMNVSVKKLNSIGSPVSTLELIAIRMGITYIFSLAYMLFTGVPDPFLGPKGVRLLLVCRGLAGFFSLFGIYYSLEFLSLSDATVITFLGPLLTGIAGALFLKENFTRNQALASLFSVFGVILIARPVFLFGDHVSAYVSTDADPIQPLDNLEKGTPTERLIAVGVALVGVLGATGAYISLRAIGTRAHPLHALVSFSIQSIFVSVISMIVTKTPFIIPTRIDWAVLIIMIGFFGFSAQVLLTMGLQRETAGRGSMAVYTQVVFATILERIFFKSVPSVLSIIGTFIIVTSALYVALTKENTNKTKLDTIRLTIIQEEGLEEGLLTAGEHVKDSTSSPRRTSNENTRHLLKTPSCISLDVSIEEPKAPSPGTEGNTKALSKMP